MSLLSKSAVTAGLVWVAASVCGWMLLTATSKGELAKLPLGVLASSTARMLVALFAGVLLYFLMPLDGKCFWTSFLFAGLLALVAEMAWSIRTMNTPRTGGVGVR